MKYNLAYVIILQITTLVSIIRNDRIYENHVEVEFVRDYFIERDIRVGIAFTCSSQESLAMLTMLMENRTAASKYNFFETEEAFVKIMKQPYYKIGIYLNYSCDFGKSIFSMSSKYGLFNEGFNWILVNNNKTVIYDLQEFNLQLDTDMIFAVVNNKTKTNADIELYDLYKIQKTRPIVITPAGFWNMESKLKITLKDTKTARRSNFQGVTIDGVGMLNQIDINRYGNSFSDIMNIQFESHLDVLNRFAFIMNMNLATLYNFTINVTFVDDWGAKTQDGSYNGMLGEIESGRFELGLSTVIMSASLMDLMDFSFPIWKFRPMFIFRNPRTFGTYQALLIPFENEVWGFIISLIIFLISILTFMKHFNTLEDKKDNDTKYTIFKSWSENLVTIIGAFSAQGLVSCSKKTSERIILYISLIVGMLLYTFYNSMVVTSLLQPPPPNIHSCEQLMDSGISIGITNISYYVKYFQMSNDDLTKRIYKKTVNSNGFMSPEEGMRRVKTKEFAFYGEEATVYPIINEMYLNNDICRLVEVELLSPHYLPCPYRKKSPLKQFVNSGLHLMRETGIVMRERKQWHKPKPICQGQNDVPSIQLQTLIVAYIILFTGICLSIIIFVIEIFYNKRTITKRLIKKKINVQEIIKNYKKYNSTIKM